MIFTSTFERILAVSRERDRYRTPLIMESTWGESELPLAVSNPKAEFVTPGQKVDGGKVTVRSAFFPVSLETVLAKHLVSILLDKGCHEAVDLDSALSFMSSKGFAPDSLYLLVPYASVLSADSSVDDVRRILSVKGSLEVIKGVKVVPAEVNRPVLVPPSEVAGSYLRSGDKVSIVLRSISSWCLLPEYDVA